MCMQHLCNWKKLMISFHGHNIASYTSELPKLNLLYCFQVNWNSVGITIFYIVYKILFI